MARHRKDDSDDLPVALTRQSLGELLGLTRYLWPYRWKFAFALLALFAGGVVSLGFPVLAGRLVDTVLAGVKDGIPEAWLANVNLVALGLMAVLAVQAAFAFLRVVLIVNVGENTLADLRRDTFSRLIRLPMAFHNARRVGELSSRIAADLTRIRDTLVETIPHFLREAVQLVGGVTLILITSPRLTGVMLASVPVIMIAAVVFGNRIQQFAKKSQDRLADSNVVVEESLQHIAGVKAYTNEPFEESRYRDALGAYLRAALRGSVYDGAFVSFIVFALFGSIVLVLWYGARLVLTGEMSAGELTQFLLLTLYVAGAVGSFAEIYSRIRKTLGAGTRVREILREPEERADGHRAGGRLAGRVEFDAVVFRYPSRPEAEVLRGVTLAAEPGQRVALVGPSGAGKSTVVSLLLRFYTPDAGVIRIDGRDAQSLDLRELRGNTAIVPQEVMLFGGTVAENIGYGKPGSSREEIEAAARQANAHDFIAGFPDGYETRVGERGVQLSGGQRQRIAIARAILRDPAILLLDEATSSLDAESERLVLEALDRLMRGRTAVIIAHRLSTVRDADRIFVLKDGTVAEAGTHAELLAREDGVYRGLTLTQVEGAAVASSA